MKRKLLLTASLLAAALGLAGCTGSEDTVGDVSLGIFTLKDIKIEHFVDPKVPGAKSKSIFFKTMKIRRIYDADTQTLLYVSYSTKETTGSFKHSLSTVPLWGTSAYQTNAPKPLTSL